MAKQTMHRTVSIKSSCEAGFRGNTINNKSTKVPAMHATMNPTQNRNTPKATVTPDQITIGIVCSFRMEAGKSNSFHNGSSKRTDALVRTATRGIAVQTETEMMPASRSQRKAAITTAIKEVITSNWAIENCQSFVRGRLMGDG
jgi:hypothetical protein